MSWIWCEWNTLDEFTSWHESIKTELGYPLPSFNQATGEEAFGVQQTVEYTQSYQVDGKVIALVEESRIQDLILSELRPLIPDWL